LDRRRRMITPVSGGLDVRHTRVTNEVPQDKVYREGKGPLESPLCSRFRRFDQSPALVFSKLTRTVEENRRMWVASDVTVALRN
jgi:hypothetical protein